MANKTSIKSTKVAKKAAASQVAAKAAKPRKTAPKSKDRKVAKPALLSGGNPQIAKADGDAPVQAYIASMPGWKRELGRRLDALIVRTVPGVRKAVKWNSPFYGIEGRGWFLSFHCFTKYIKIAFFRGASLSPVPPGRIQEQGHALHRHPRGRPARRSAARRLGEASRRVARRTHVSGTSRGGASRFRNTRVRRSFRFGGQMRMSAYDPKQTCRAYSVERLLTQKADRLTLQILICQVSRLRRSNSPSSTLGANEAVQDVLNAVEVFLLHTCPA